MGDDVTEENLFAWDWGTDPDGARRLRRTIVAMCKLRVKIERDDRGLSGWETFLAGLELRCVAFATRDRFSSIRSCIEISNPKKHILNHSRSP
ncbi:hypothetical protein KC336_g41 [Hortaea werneckii]|nr:hypothetical protein KC336_g41 [Hortaea werneckii]